MTSKDKLIEFLKSTNISYTESCLRGYMYINCRTISYKFDSNGKFINYAL